MKKCKSNFQLKKLNQLSKYIENSNMFEAPKLEHLPY